MYAYFGLEEPFKNSSCVFFAPEYEDIQQHIMYKAACTIPDCGHTLIDFQKKLIVSGSKHHACIKPGQNTLLDTSFGKQAS